MVVGGWVVVGRSVVVAGSVVVFIFVEGSLVVEYTAASVVDSLIGSTMNLFVVLAMAVIGGDVVVGADVVVGGIVVNGTKGGRILSANVTLLRSTVLTLRSMALRKGRR